MKALAFIHIGDIHYPELKSEPFHVDRKDQGMDQSWIRQLAPNKIKRISEKILQLLSTDEEVRGVLVSGDLTSKGNVEGYKECVAYLSRALSLSDVNLWRNRCFHVVPGNHDVDRSVAKSTQADLFQKFDAVEGVWRAVMPDVMSPRSVRSSDIEYHACRVRVISINTCVGCGETRYLPNKVRAQLAEVLKTYADKQGVDKSFDLIGEQLDTPAILEEHVNRLELLISEAERTLPLVLGHHGILPQALMRVDLYAELINSGYVRSRLSSLGTAIIYCHGHIHTDPVEVVEQPSTVNSKLVLVSAPQFSEGFNVVRLYFTDSGVPVGCEVVPYRLEDHGSIRGEGRIRVPLLHGPSAAQVCDTRAAKYLGAMSSTTRRLPWLRSAITTSTGSAPHHNTMTKYLQQLEWLGLIQILNRDDPPEHWQVRRVEP